VSSDPARGARAAQAAQAAQGAQGAQGARPVIKAEDVRIWYGTERGPVRAVDGVSFELRKGEILGLVGESGCGKSSLGRGLLGLLPEGARMDGRLEFHGEDLLGVPPRERAARRGAQLGMIFQEPLTRLNPLMRISEHFRETLRTHERGLSKVEIDRRALDVLRRMGIPPTRYRSYPHEFSGGMRQRLMIALALVLRPDFVVADEPTTALDVLVEANIIRILHDLRGAFDTSLLLITHNLGIIAEACDRVAVMYAGEIVEIGDAREVFSHPQHPYTRELLRSTISLSTTGLHFIPGAPPDLVEPPPACHFHPRCPDAMGICARQWPAPRTLPNGSRVQCWAAEDRNGLIELHDVDRQPLARKELSVADEA
jgi:peptide/nickel transport system ATP-binding protein